MHTGANMELKLMILAQVEREDDLRAALLRLRDVVQEKLDAPVAKRGWWGDIEGAAMEVKAALPGSREVNPCSRPCCDAMVYFYFPAGDEEAHVRRLLSFNFALRALKFLPALVLTLGIEYANAAFMANQADWLNSHFVLVAFVPIISAIAGNIGLQTSSSITAYLNVRKDEGEGETGVWALLRELFPTYMAHSLPNVLVMAVLMTAVVFTLEASNDPCQFNHASIVFIGSLVNMLVASAMGILTPVIAHSYNYDPSTVAGPFETALQDVIGFIFFLWMAKTLIDQAPPASCSLGSCTTVCDKDYDNQCMVQRCKGSVPCYQEQCVPEDTGIEPGTLIALVFGPIILLGVVLWAIVRWRHRVNQRAEEERQQQDQEYTTPLIINQTHTD